MIEVKNLVKRYGKLTALKGISFSVKSGEIVGLLGHNGAGKSTAMNIIAGYLSSTSGTVEIGGHDILSDAENAKKQLGYLPEQVPLYPDMTVNEYLNFIFELKKCSFNRKKHLDEICSVVKIEDVRDRLINNLSKGYRQRIGIAQALIGNPKVIILDEPTVGLDPSQIVEVRNLIRILGRDHAVILSTHILSEVQAVCDRIIIINNGAIVADDTADEIAEMAGGAKRIKATISGPAATVASAIRMLDGVKDVKTLASREADCFEYIIESEHGVDIRRDLFELARREDYPILSLAVMEMKLEDVFLSLTGRGARARANNGGRK